MLAASATFLARRLPDAMGSTIEGSSFATARYERDAERRLAIRLADDRDHLLFRETRFAHCSLRVGSQSLT